MTVEESYVDAYDATLTAWAEIGDSPYLQNTSTDYIWTSTNNAEEGVFTFPASAGSGTINSVKIRVKGRVTSEYGDVRLYVYDGSSWTDKGLISLPVGSTLDWVEVDVSAQINTWAKRNAAAVKFKFEKVATCVATMDRCTIKADYTEEAVGVAKQYGDGLVCINWIGRVRNWLEDLARKWIWPVLRKSGLTKSQIRRAL